MLQVKIVQETEASDLNKSINDFLATIKSEDVKDIKFELSDYSLIAIIQYEVVEPWAKAMCCDCQYWDDGGTTDAVGLCHECGQRKRFNCKACTSFKDVRG